MWGPTDIEIVHADTSDSCTFVAYITDSKNGCVRRYRRCTGSVEAYLPTIFGFCGVGRNTSVDFPTYVAADASDIGSNGGIPKLFVAYTEMNEIRFHDPGPDGGSAPLDAKDEGARCGKEYSAVWLSVGWVDNIY